MSAWEERQGHGSKLVTVVEGLSRQEGVDVIVSYPAPTQQAEGFWSKMGYDISHFTPEAFSLLG